MRSAVAGKDRACGGMAYVKRWFIPDCFSRQRYIFSAHGENPWRFRSTLRVADIALAGEKEIPPPPDVGGGMTTSAAG
jgi:hypothetical protein